MTKKEIILKVKSLNVLPNILTSNTYFWRPGGGASGRRNNERKQKGLVEEFLVRFGFCVRHTDAGIVGSYEELEVRFSYSESCKNVYKVLEIRKGGKKVTIRELYYHIYFYMMKDVRPIDHEKKI